MGANHSLDMAEVNEHEKKYIGLRLGIFFSFHYLIRVFRRVDGSQWSEIESERDDRYSSQQVCFHFWTEDERRPSNHDLP